MNWSRARMDVIIGQRGSERAFERSDSPRPTTTNKSKSKRKRKAAKPAAPRPLPPRRSKPENPVVAERRALRRRFARLSPSERQAAAKSYRARLRALSESQATLETLWRTNFEPLLAPGRASAQPRRGQGSARHGSTTRRQPTRSKPRTGRSIARKRATQVAQSPAREATARTGLPNGVRPDARLWAAKDGAGEPGILFTAVGLHAARVAVIRDGRPVLRLLPAAALTPRAQADRTDHVLAAFLAGDPAGPRPARTRPSAKKPKARKKRKGLKGPVRASNLCYAGTSGARGRVTFWRGRAKAAAHTRRPGTGPEELDLGNDGAEAA